MLFIWRHREWLDPHNCEGLHVELQRTLVLLYHQMFARPVEVLKRQAADRDNDIIVWLYCYTVNTVAALCVCWLLFTQLKLQVGQSSQMVRLSSAHVKARRCKLDLFGHPPGRSKDAGLKHGFTLCR